MSKRRSGTAFAVTLFFVASAAAGCAVSTEPSASGASETEVRGAKIYDCRGGPPDQALGRFELELTRGSAKITDLSRSATPPAAGEEDPTYRPTSPTYRGATRFVGYAEIESALSEVSTVELMVSQSVMEGASEGRTWVRMAGGSGGSTESYTCEKRQHAMAVDLDRRARVMCELERLACTPSDPGPGDTCLADLFLMQAEANRASLRLEWYDHFGVQAAERRELLGVSDSFARTTRRIRGSWDGYEVELNYRAGVTYLGEVILPDGRTAELRCSDLAMLDP